MEVITRFHLIAGHPALDFVNTLDNRYDPTRTVDLVPDYRTLVSFCVQACLLSESYGVSLLRTTAAAEAGEAVAAASALRESLFGIFTAVARKARPPGEELEKLNRLFRLSAQARRITWVDDKVLWEFEEDDKQPTNPVWRLASAAGDLLISPARSQIRECCCDACRWLFLDVSKNHSRRWCDMKICGNRVKARRFQSKRRI